MILLNIKTVVLAALLGLAVGGVGGAYVTYKLVHGNEAEEVVEQLQDVRKDDANAVADSQAKSQAVQDELTKIDEFSEDFQQEARKQIEQQPRPDTARPDAPFVVEGSGLRLPYQHEYLSYGLVCVLNAARDNRKADCPAAGSYEASRTVTEATFAAFVANDLQVVRMYHELAARHDALVEYVLELQADQRKRLGIEEQTEVATPAEESWHWEN